MTVRLLWVAAALGTCDGASQPASSVAASVRWTKVASWPFKNAAVASLVPPTPNPSPNRPSLLLTTFGFASGDGVYAVGNLTAAAATPAPTAFVEIDNGIHWPNQAEMAPSPLGPSGWGKERTLVLECGGFFPNPTKATGQIILTDMTDAGSPVQHLLSHPKKNWFYHKVRATCVRACCHTHTHTAP
jgi:hypothetical protein